MTFEYEYNSASLPLFAPERYRWLVVFLMWLGQLVYFYIYSSVAVLGPVLKGELGLNNTEFGILCGAIGVGTTVVQIPGGLWCDRLGIRIVLTLAFILITICSFTFSLVFSSISLPVWSNLSAAKGTIISGRFRG